MESKQRYILIDCDTGSDDALAIWMTIAAHRDPISPVKIVGIVCAHGNTTSENVATNVIRTLHAVEEYKIPVFVGAQQAIVHPFTHPIEPFHGNDGFGDNDFPPLSYKEASNFSEEHGVLAMCRLAKEYDGKLTIIALAAHTNLAMAARLDPSICHRLEAIYTMGGNVDGEGNATVSAEFNFAVDPEAAFITMSAFSCPIYVVPWEVTKNHAISHEWRAKVLGEIDTPQVHLLNAVEKKILEKYTDSWIACDQFAAAAAIEPKVIKKSISRYCTVELAGNWTRGLMVVDKLGLMKKPHNVIIITEFDQELSKSIMLWGAGGEHYECRKTL
ncbi:hypothetical protein Ocin01_01814 [Orchesella cincta]|uniref:Inosine/uridine-preferring nucleoside hydrolase domain-containing protein n=1 Tax=Orchesella cincta TaxID=48709 RepID=A0A1D2NHU9_ORCCI|nr:hypothetical protein Ocin01_01814 [Orchesella cincta]